MRRWTLRHPRIHALGIAFLVLIVSPAPWPRVEFHEVRHLDLAGQVCELHDHLLRWHPDASQGGAGVSVLHYHWVIPSAPDVDDGDHQGNYARLHASHHPSPEASAIVGVEAPASIDSPARPTPPDAPELASIFGPYGPTADVPPDPFPDAPTARTFGATFARQGLHRSLLSRWSC